MSNELNLALRIKTDLEAGRKDVEELAKSVERVGEAATSTSAGTSGMGNSVTQLINDMRAFEEANNGALRSMEDIAEQEERLDRLMTQGAITTKEYEEALRSEERRVGKERSNRGSQRHWTEKNIEGVENHD